MIIELVCKRFRSLSYWPNSYYLHLGGESNSALTINGSSFPYHRWLRCIDALLKRVEIEEMKQAVKACDVILNPLTGIFFKHKEKFKLKAFSATCGARISWLFAIQSTIASISHLDFDQNNPSIIFPVLLSALDQKPLKYLHVRWLLWHNVVNVCNNLKPGTLETLVVSNPNPNWAIEVDNDPELNAAAVSSVTHLTLTHELRHAQKSFPKMVLLVLPKFPNLQNLVLSLSGEAYFTDAEDQTIPFTVLDTFLALNLPLNVRMDLCLPLCWIRAMNGRLPGVRFNTNSGGFYTWSSGQLSITAEAKPWQWHQIGCPLRLCKLKQEVFRIFILKYKQIVKMPGDVLFLHPCEADQFMNDIHVQYPSASLWPAVFMAVQLGTFTLLNRGNEITIEARDCDDATCELCH